QNWLVLRPGRRLIDKLSYPLNLRVSVILALYRTEGSVDLPLNGAAVSIPEAGDCSIERSHYDPVLYCESPSPPPVLFLVGDRVCLRALSPWPALLEVSPIRSSSVWLAGSGRPRQLVVERPIARIRRDVEIQGIQPANLRHR